MSLRLLTIPILLFTFCGLLKGQEKTNDWEDPTVFGINKLAPHGYFIPYQNQESALSFE